MRFILFLILGFLSAATESHANTTVVNEELRLDYRRAAGRTSFIFGAETANLASETASITGFGPRFGLEYSFTDAWSFAANVNFAFQMTGKAGAFFYSGLSGNMRYTFIGSSRNQSEAIISSNGRNIYSMENAIKQRAALLVGLEQLFLNGTTSIYPAVGVAVGGSYSFSMFNRAFDADLRYSTMTANGNPLSMISVGISTGLGI
ncbi:MAG: hypothetical protein ACLGGX_03170 [Bdellovibrionia bacterium]